MYVFSSESLLITPSISNILLQTVESSVYGSMFVPMFVKKHIENSCTKAHHTEKGKYWNCEKIGSLLLHFNFYETKCKQ